MRYKSMFWYTVLIKVLVYEINFGIRDKSRFGKNLACGVQFKSRFWYAI